MRLPAAATLGRIAGMPAVALAVAAHGVLALLVAAAILVLRMPEDGMRFRQDGAGVTVTMRDGAVVRVGADVPIVIEGARRRVAIPAGWLVPDHMPGGGTRDVSAFYAMRDRLAAIVAAPDARVTLPGGGTRRIATQARGLGDLPADFWLLAAQAIAIGMLGVWIRLTAPRQLGAWMFGASCDGVLLAGFSGAVFDARTLSADGTLLWAMHALNLIGSNLCAAGLAALFLYLPRRNAPRWIGAAMLAGAVALGIAEGAGAIPLAGFYALLVVPNLVLVAAVAVQWRAARGDPTARTAIRLVGASSFAGAVLVCAGMVVPALFGVPPFASDGMTLWPLALIYGGIAFGVAGVRLFALDTWSYRLVLGAATLLLLLACDAAIVRLIDPDRPFALALALLATGYAYLPLRAWLWQRIAGARPLPREAMFRQAALAAFAPDARERRDGWRELLERVFAPLELAPGEAVDRVAATGGGEELRLPATADDAALRLRFAARGTRLFSPADVELAGELVSLAHEAAKARAAYVRGVDEERRRIARDLHDDVSAMLLTGLHRREVAEVRGDVQQALGEIRSMVSSLTGGSRRVADVLADLRYETANRLAAAGVALDWPVGDAADMAQEGEAHEGGGATLDYARARALASSLREIVTNAIKHAGARRLRVAVTHHAHALDIVASDDGDGGRAHAPRAGSGRGLANVAQRLDEVGGTCRVEPTTTGFRVRLSLPLPG